MELVNSDFGYHDNNSVFVGFQVHTTVTIRSTIFGDVASCGFVKI
jgi:hypothetical protein